LFQRINLLFGPEPAGNSLKLLGEWTPIMARPVAESQNSLIKFADNSVVRFRC